MPRQVTPFATFLPDGIYNMLDHHGAVLKLDPAVRSDFSVVQLQSFMSMDLPEHFAIVIQDGHVQYTLTKEEYYKLKPKPKLKLPDVLAGLGDVEVTPSAEERQEILQAELVNAEPKRKGMPKGGWPKKDV